MSDDPDPLDTAMAAAQASPSTGTTLAADPLDEAMVAAHGEEGAAPSSSDAHPRPSPAKSSRPSGGHPTQFRQAGASPPVPERELSWGDTLQQAGANLIPSAGQAAGGIWNAVTHPGDTLHNLGQIATGAGSQVAGALGATQDAKQKGQNEALITALENHYKQGYGSVAGFKKNLATDPVGVAMDASMLADPAAGLLGKVGEAGKFGAVSKAAGIASKALPYVNPIRSAVALARAPGAAASWVGRGVGSVTSGVPLTALKMATEVGASGNPAIQGAFSQFATGQANATDLADAAQSAMQKIRDRASAAYLAGKGALANTQPSFAPIDAAVADARAKTMMGGRAFQQQAGQFQKANDAVDQADSMIQAWKNSGNPAMTGLDGVDNLKQAIFDQASSHQTGSAANTALMKIYHGVRSALVDADPDYATLMENYQSGLRNTKDLTQTLGLGKNAAASATLAKNLKALKTGTGQNLLRQLIDEDPKIGGMLAGSAVNPWTQRSSLWEAALGAGLPSIFAHPLGAMAAVPGALAGYAASSPRIVGSAANLAGKASRAIGVAGSPLVQGAAKGLYYGSRPDALSSGASGGTSPPKPSGTRIPRGIRNNNPTNLTSTASGWPGQTGKDSDFATFDSPQHGMEAADKNLAAYGARHGIDTVRQAVMRWTGNGASPAYINGVAKAANVRPDDHIDLSDPNLRAAMLRAIVGFENGPQYAARGGRIERADGGKVEDQHEFLVQRLMNVAKQARMASNKATEPLLKVPDSTVARALEVSGRAL